MPNTAHVTILLATYNGGFYLAEQLNSIVQQTHKNLQVIASDDGSTDDTLQILKQYSIETHEGPHQGSAANFFHLIKIADERSDYYAFADQDDVWEHDKLQQAINYLQSVKPDTPALYCARTLLVDEHLTPFGYSPLFKRPPNFLNALVQNIAGGNTMVFNRAAFNLLRQTTNAQNIVAHDWWAYLLISGAGGHVFYNPTPSLRYRQHKSNLVGSNVSWKARCYRIRMLYQGRLKSWIDCNNKSLLEVAHLLTTDNRRYLEAFESARSRSLIPRFISIMKLRIYRQTTFGQIGLLVGALFNKL